MTVKKFESPSISGEDMDKNFWLTFGQPCRRMCKRKTLFAPPWNSLPLFERTADSFTSFRMTYVADQDIYSQDICSRSASAVRASGTLTRTSCIINSLITCLLFEFRVSARQHDWLCSDVMWCDRVRVIDSCWGYVDRLEAYRCVAESRRSFGQVDVCGDLNSQKVSLGDQPSHSQLLLLLCSLSVRPSVCPSLWCSMFLYVCLRYRQSLTQR